MKTVKWWKGTEWRKKKNEWKVANERINEEVEGEKD